jgi:hypothetical protein
MFYVPSLGIYTQMSSPTPVPIFINRTQHFWVITNLMSVMLLQSWFSVFISTSYTKSFVWPQKLKSKGMKSKDRGHHRTGTSQKVSHKRRCSSTKVEWDGRTPSGKRSLYSRHAALELPRVLRHRVNANRRILVL